MIEVEMKIGCRLLAMIAVFGAQGAFAQGDPNAAQRARGAQQACKAQFDTAWKSRIPGGPMNHENLFFGDMLKPVIAGCRSYEPGALRSLEMKAAARPKTINTDFDRKGVAVADDAEARLCVLHWLGSPHCAPR